MSITYKEGQSTLLYYPLWWHEQHRQQTATGYGKKLTTPYKVEHNGRLYRVYCICYSNSGTLYILPGGKPLYLRDAGTEVSQLRDNNARGGIQWSSSS